MSKIDVALLGPESAHELSPLVAGYVQEMRRGAPPRPDDYYAAEILKDRHIEIVGARLDGVLVGFVLFYDLPDFLSGLRMGEIDVFFVHPEKRVKGVGTALINWITEEGRRRDWSHVRWLVNEKTATETSLHGRLAEPAPWRAYVIHIHRKMTEG